MLFAIGADAYRAHCLVRAAAWLATADGNGDAPAVSKRESCCPCLRSIPEGLTDAELARMTGLSHQTVNQTCRRLAAENLIRRDDLDCPIMNLLTSDPPPDERLSAPATHHEHWFWEGNVQSIVVSHLAPAMVIAGTA